MPINTRFASILAALPIPNRPPRSLSLGCGVFPELPILRERWADWLHIGVDVDGGVLRQGVRVQAHAARLPFACDFSLIIIRHPDIARWRAGWRAVLTTAPRYLARGGVLLATSYTLDEHEFICAAQPLLQMPPALFLPPDLAGRDRYVAVYVCQPA